MAGSQNNYWEQPDLSRLCFGLSAAVDHNLTELQQQQITREPNANIALSHSPFYPDAYRLTADGVLRPHEGDQVVPSSQRRTPFAGYQREAKPLPPPPDPEELMSDEAADSEVEFFTSDRRRLLPKSCPKPVFRGGNRGCGQVNGAYRECSPQAGGAGAGSVAFSWPGGEDRATGRGCGFGAEKWTLAPQHKASAVGDASSPGLRFPAFADKPQVPPRIPIPPKPAALTKGAADEDDKPPKIPPRVPLVPPCPPRTLSPKCLPIYINGVMPATQSFAANPKYVSKALLRPRSERAPPAAQFTPCIVPILKDGRQASATHYILLPPGRQAHADRRERLLSEPARTGNSIWQNR